MVSCNSQFNAMASDRIQLHAMSVDSIFMQFIICYIIKCYGISWHNMVQLLNNIVQMYNKYSSLKQWLEMADSNKKRPLS